MSAIGTKRPASAVRSSPAIGAKPDITRTAQFGRAQTRSFTSRTCDWLNRQFQAGCITGGHEYRHCHPIAI
jgi:hypothetical protein